MITNKNEDEKQPVWLHETNCIYAFTRKTYQIMSDVDRREIEGIQYPTKAIEETLCFLKPKPTINSSHLVYLSAPTLEKKDVNG